MDDKLLVLFNNFNIKDNVLPIAQYKQEIIEKVRSNQIVIIFGETGSGKTTQIPQYLLEAGINNDLVIGVTQPRRIAAVNMASRVCSEMHCALGYEVGYEIRFQKRISASTKIKFMTDGILLNYCLTDAKLSEYGIIMIDEAHERTVDTDVLLGLLKMIAKKRKDLKILITSATITTEKFSQYFSGAPVIKFGGKMFEVEIIYEPVSYYSLSSVVNIVKNIHSKNIKGDILIFLTGQEDIENCCEILNGIANLVVLPLYGAMDYDSQQTIFNPVSESQRKVIVSTNIAETSITIDGIRFVIDSGYVKQNQYDPRTGIEVLANVKISQPQADQRKGRAGRTNTGWCYRMYSSSTYSTFSKETIPEIYRKNLCGTYLRIAAMGLDPMTFPFIDAPENGTLQRCLKDLQDLELISLKNEITELGHQMEDFPVEPRIGKALICSSIYSCSLDVVTMLAMLTEKNVFNRPKKLREDADRKKKQFFDSNGDPFMLLNIFNKWIENNRSKSWCFENFVQFKTLEQVDLVRSQFIMVMKRKNLSLVSSNNKCEDIKKAIISGFYKNICYRRSRGIYVNYNSKEVLYIHPSSCLMNTEPILILYYEVVKTNKPYMRGLITVTSNILSEFPKQMKNIGYTSSVLYSRNFREQLDFDFL